MQAELEKQKHDEATRYAADKRSSDHLIGELHIEKEHEIHGRRENAKNMYLNIVAP